MATRDMYEQTFDEEHGEIEATTCPECEGTLATDGGEIACIDCGLIIDEYRLAHSLKPRDFSDRDTSTERTGAPLTPARHDRGLSTDIGYGRDGNGNALNGATRRRLGRLRIQHTRAQRQSKTEHNLSMACGEIARVVAALDLSTSIREEASQIYRLAMGKDLIRGRSIEAMATAAVYAACRCRGLPRSLKEVTSVARVSERRVTNAYRVLNAALDIRTQLVTPHALVSRLASEFDVSDDIRSMAHTR